jgi:peptide chain release factor 3
VSGRFEGNMEVEHARLKRAIRLANPKEFFGKERDTIVEAWPGDIVGIMNTGLLAIGDTLYTGPAIRFPGIPRFSPEHFGVMRCTPSQRKAFNKGLEQLLMEGAVMGLNDPGAAGNDMVLGAVGPLQFEVMVHRLKNEYRVDATLDAMPYKLARWLKGPAGDIEELKSLTTLRIVEDLQGHPVGLFRDPWSLQGVEKQHDSVAFSSVAPLD